MPVARSRTLLSLAAPVLLLCVPLCAADDPVPDPAIHAAPAINHERMFGVMPDYQTVRDPNARYQPLTSRQKWHLVALSAVDPFNLAGAVIGAGVSQIANDTPRYGWGGEAYGYRVGAAFADIATQTVFAGALSVGLHQDPRYFRKGAGAGIPRRLAYSVSRVLITRTDSGSHTVNTSNLCGMALGIAASNLYYPSSSRTGAVMAGRFQSSLTGEVIGNLMSEFWPDIQSRLFHRHNRRPEP